MVVQLLDTLELQDLVALYVALLMTAPLGSKAWHSSHQNTSYTLFPGISHHIKASFHVCLLHIVSVLGDLYTNVWAKICDFVND
jgi:hypothetical protein